MGLNDTPRSNRIHIGFFGSTNSGKSSVINAVTNQELSIVSDVSGTTTDPVMKSMEILPLGPVVVIDTPGFNDNSILGGLRVNKTIEILDKVSIAVLIIDVTKGIEESDKKLIKNFNDKKIKYIIAFNKTDLVDDNNSFKEKCIQDIKNLNIAYFPKNNIVFISAINKVGIEELKNMLAKINISEEKSKSIIGDLIDADDFVMLVTPIDSSAPKGRLILPQQMVLRDILDNDAQAIVVKENAIEKSLKSMNVKPKLVITDSQVFKLANEATPKDIQLTSFSILLARYKGILETTVKGVTKIESLEDGDRVLIAEGCTHHRQCEDIGTVKIPNWLKGYTKKNISIEFLSGADFPKDLTKYALVIHCGGCMLNDREVRNRMNIAVAQNIPFTNYGIAISYMQGILKRSISMFSDLSELIKN